MDDRDERDQDDSDQVDVVEDAGWLTPEIQAALNRVRGGKVGKRRETIIRVAFARAMGQTLEPIFRLPGVINQRVWYQVVKPLPTVQAAYELCFERALAWRDAETARMEAEYANERRRVIAEESVSAVRGLAMTALRVIDRADYRTEASKVLLRLADPELAVRLVDEKGQAVPVAVEGLDALIEHQLDRVAGGEGERAES